MSAEMPADHPGDVLIEAHGLRVDIPIRHAGRSRQLHAVDGVDLTIRRGEVLGLVGESGCGKSTTGRALIRLNRPTAGQILFDGVDIASLPQRKLRPLRCRMQMIFQHPGLALNPRLPVGRSIAEPLEAVAGRSERDSRVEEMLVRVGLLTGTKARYPHELSGGQLQRVAIARALVAEPDFIVADEPLSSLDVSVQAQIMALFKELQRELAISSLFITHDLGIAEYLSNRISVMYLGKLVETASAFRFSRTVQHPYSRALLDAVPRLDPVVERMREPVFLSGEVPSPLTPPAGCRFSTRCPLAKEQCRGEQPPLRQLSADHEVACWLV